jgi:hypothetical protein
MRRRFGIVAVALVTAAAGITGCVTAYGLPTEAPVTEQVTTPTGDPTVCAAAAFLAYDAYATGNEPAELAGAMEACAESVGGF